VIRLLLGLAAGLLLALPAPALTPRHFTVYFATGATISPHGADVIDELANYVLGGRGTVLVRGHADTAGAELDNDRLSRRRAEVVRNALIARGVDRHAIRIEWKGERQLAVATGDGISEAHNRRVEMIPEFPQYEVKPAAAYPPTGRPGG
jgi:outer membrane protein OmpA-like peptidoglycan-associated protein